VELTPAELPADDPQAAAERLLAAVEEAYLRREIEYPCQYAIDITVGRAGADNVYALTAMCDWANRKYQAGWSPENLAGKSVEQLQQDLIELAEQFFTGDRLGETVETFLAGLARTSAGHEVTPEQFPDVIQWCKKRFDTDISEADLTEGEILGVLVDAGRAFLRRELTELERFVLLQIYDTSWKDHLLAMDHLKSGVGLHSYAEQDPRIVYKREGFRLFEEMLSSVRRKVTDLVFKARLGREAEMTSVYQVSQLVHEQLSGYDDLARDMAAQQAAAEAQKPQTIIRATPKVGRNDPCPCGSGKKFKKCCGRNK
jgi:preprotein translocase subunit SecA